MPLDTEYVPEIPISKYLGSLTAEQILRLFSKHEEPKPSGPDSTIAELSMEERLRSLGQLEPRQHSIYSGPSLAIADMGIEERLEFLGQLKQPESDLKSLGLLPLDQPYMPPSTNVKAKKSLQKTSRENGDSIKLEGGAAEPEEQVLAAIIKEVRDRPLQVIIPTSWAKCKVRTPDGKNLEPISKGLEGTSVTVRRGLGSLEITPIPNEPNPEKVRIELKKALSTAVVNTPGFEFHFENRR